MISCDYAHEKKSSRFLFHNIYLKENKIENLQRHVEDEKSRNKVLRSFMNDFKTLKKNTQYTTKVVTIDDIQKYNKMYDENSKFNEMSFKDDVSHVVQFMRFQLQFITSSLIVKEYNQDVKAELLRKNVSRAKNNIYQCKSQFIKYFLFMNAIDYSFAKRLTNYEMSKNDIDTFFRNLDLQQMHTQFNNFYNIEK